MFQRSKVAAAIFFAVFAFVVSAAAQGTLPGDVVEVIDGRTVVLEIQTGRATIELQYIDVPTTGPMAETVKKHLRNLVFKKRIEYRARSLSFDRTIGQIFVGGVDVSQQLLRDGAAWHTPAELSGQDATEFAQYASIEASAKKEKRGVWSKPDLRPSWEQPRRETTASIRPVVSSTRPQLAKPGYWGDKNPKMGDIGALFNGYNAASRKGYLSSGLFGLRELNGIEAFTAAKVAIDFTYYYSEEKAERTGTYVMTMVAVSSDGHFSKENSLILYYNDQSINLGKPKRSVVKNGEDTIETLRYVLNKSSIEKMINTEGANLRIKDLEVFLVGSKYILYNMLDLSK